ncbi:uncharacterized protein BCR38DRAFT_412715 [Pseudomassariella vexata]|uniref:RBR-type E3 ubiquitin transferase n=1 Tax=Pseudomassariella vexata TaxID=1141098 RepID=A0A1Y2DKC3_9PEZI|nr:uncharacterized protein BCR38DRAFT_412715 [Pseudomassariella vexata]ORY59720.1 hypothetical protein BCR38DRAFT_412715 [Pseudomassariella vexata]
MEPRSAPVKRKKAEQYQRDALRPFVLVRRVGQWGRQNAANDDDIKASNKSPERLHGRVNGRVYIADADGDGDSDTSQYSDAHSNFELPIDTQNLPDPVLVVDAMSEAECSIAGPSQAVSNPFSYPQSGDGGSSYSLDDGGTRDRLRDVQSSLETFPIQFGTKVSPQVPPNPSNFDRLRRLWEGDASVRPALSLPNDHESKPQESKDGDELTLEKGKAVERRPDWTSAVNPWAGLNKIMHEEGERETLMAENNRLKAELQELRDTLSKNSRRRSTETIVETQINTQDEARVPTQADTEAGEAGFYEPTRLPVSSPRRIRRPKSKRRQDMTLFETTTLRDLVLKRIFAPNVMIRRPNRPENDQKGAAVTLDTPLTRAQIQEFSRIMNDVIIEGRNLKQPIALCAVCHLPKFKEARGLNQQSYISEVLAQCPTLPVTFEDFHPALGLSRCCRKYVCKTCLSAGIIAGIATHWWHDLANRESAWIKCPVPCCRHSLPLQDGADVMGVLEALCVDDVPKYIKQFNHANQLRCALQAIDMMPTREEMRQSMALHNRLVKYEKMWPLLDDIPPGGDTSVDTTVKVELMPLDTANRQGTSKIPIFTHLFRSREPRDCIVCADTHQEFNYGGPLRWAKATKGFEGEWTWRILSFPVAELLPDCQHDFDICRTCLNRHIITQLELQGYGAVDNINCPTPECHHTYTHSEIRILAMPETFAMYDRYAVLNSLSNQPNFRWCLGEGCTSGGLYDDPSQPDESVKPLFKEPNRIMCSECKFNMCFACQIPWHTGLDCAQHASLQAHGDPNYSRTQEWIESNTKPCPGQGCGVLVVKGEGCFHMTCSQCRFEFCWECLADWTAIFNAATGEIRSDAHREGCYFRGAGAVLPTQVMGSTLARGLRRLEQQAAPAPAPAVPAAV